jgi:hypothetical protein
MTIILTYRIFIETGNTRLKLLDSLQEISFIKYKSYVVNL